MLEVFERMKDLKKRIATWTLLAAVAVGFCAPNVARAEEEDPASPAELAAWKVELAAFQPYAPEPSGPPAIARSIDAADTRIAAGPAGNARRQPTGALSGKIIYIGGGHGWTYDDLAASAEAWYTQRGNNNSVVEDYGNQAQMTLFASYLWNAGATVVSTRPIGFQSNEVVMDQEEATYTGTWSTSTGTPYYSKTASGVNDTVHYRFAAGVIGSETATARYTPTIPADGLYPVYTWVLNSSNRVNQLYRVHHAGGDTEARINHRRVGKGWMWLGTYYFEAGTAGYVEISNNLESGETQSNVIADAIRFGNGMGDQDFGEGVSGFAREEEASRYWAMISTGKDASNVPSMSSIWDASTSHQNDNVGTPPRWVAYMNDETQSPCSGGFCSDSLYISFHSNAGGGRGAVGLINLDSSTRSPNQATLADKLGREVNEDMRQIDDDYFPNYTAWTNTTTHTYTGTINFGEMRDDAVNDEMDLTINEVAFHDDASDTQYLRDPKGRRLLARATLQGVIRFFDAVYATSSTMPPDEPRNLRALNAVGLNQIVLTWEAPAAIASIEAGTPGNVGGDAPTGYVIYTSNDGKEFEYAGSVGSGTTTYTVSASLGTSVYAIVSATNAGGESFPSNVAGARVHGTRPPILVVDGFDRNDNGLALRVTVSGISGRTDLGEFRRVDPRRINDFSYVAQAGRAISGGSVVRDFDYAPNDDIVDGDVLLTDYDTVVWILGEESSVDETFNATEQTLVTTFRAGGGNLFLSGAEIGWDLDRDSGPLAADRTFINGQLHGDLAGNANDDADTYNVTGTAGNIFASIGAFSFDDGTMGTYQVEFPDQIAATGSGAAQALTYVGGLGGSAAITYDGTAGGGRVVFFGFPFETIVGESTRASIMDAVLTFFTTPVPVEVSGFTLE